jgi:hypothetical protein
MVALIYKRTMSKPSTVRFSAKAAQIIRRLKRKLGVTQTAIIEMALRDYNEAFNAVRKKIK